MVRPTTDSLPVIEQSGVWFKVGENKGSWVHGDFFIPEWAEVKD